jgi:hypothetical protein
MSEAPGIVTSMVDHARAELEAAGIVGPVAESVMALAREFDPEAPSAAVVADIFWKLANMGNLTPLMDSPDDWVPDPGDPGRVVHRRCRHLSRVPGGPAVYSRAIAFTTNEGAAWFGRCWADRDRTTEVGSSLEVLSFPFKPRTFVVEVERVPVGENLVDDFLSDPRQLRAAAPIYLVP